MMSKRADIKQIRKYDSGVLSIDAELFAELISNRFNTNCDIR